MAVSDDEDESYIFLGNQLEPYDDDESRKKLISAAELQAKDQKGRPRFHGAFTGGFSAGYFNTVGSEQGFIPSTFTSSRKDKLDKSDNVTKPEDFMDEEDFGEHGIAPRKFVTADKFSSDERKRKRVETAAALSADSVISGEKALVDLIVPERLTVGVQLLRIMGWKEGQGLGPRQKRKKKKLKHEPGVKIYGCALPDSSGNEDDIPEFLEDIKFAPKDVCPIDFQVKDNIHGIGYKGLDPKLALPSSSTHINLFSSSSSSFRGQKGIKGQAFGIGALEDEDEDIYTIDSISNYDMTMEKEEENMFGWTAPSRQKKGLQQKSIQYIGIVLQGFMVSSVPSKQSTVSSLTPIPRDFKPYHKFVGSAQQMSNRSRSQGIGQKHNAITRSLVLGEKPVITQDSSLPVLPANDKEKLDNPKRQKKENRFSLPEFRTSSVSTVSPATEAKTKAISLPFSQGMSQFQPFLRDPEKQGRYEKYLALSQEGKKDAFEQVELSIGHRTEWEQEHEREEFIKAAKLYKPLKGLMASRFTSAKFEDSKTVDVTQEIAKDDQTKAAEMKMYGRLTRAVHEWHPDRVLCKRFNVPDPYPGSTLLGVPKVKHDKYSIFNMMAFQAQEDNHSDPLLPLPAPIKTISQDLNEERIEIKQIDKPQEAKSIFNSLFEKQSEKKNVKPDQPTAPQPEKENTDTDKEIFTADDDENTEERPPMDLFKAIFKNTDTEDSSSSSNEEEETVVQPTPTSQQTKISDDTTDQSLSKAVEKSSTNFSSSGTTSNSCETADSQSNRETVHSQLQAERVCNQEYSDTANNQNSSKTVDSPGLSPHRKRKHKHKDKEKHKKKKRKKEKTKKAKHKTKKKKENKQSHHRHSRPVLTDSSEYSDNDSD